MAPTPPFTDRRLQNFKADVFGGDVWLQAAGQFNLIHFGHGDVISTTAHGDSHIQAAGTHGQHAQTAAGGGMGVGTDQSLAGFAEAFQVYLMANAVARSGEPHAEFFGRGLDKPMVVGVFKATL